MRPRVLAEMRRVTRPGGRVFVVDYYLPPRGLKRWLAYHFIKTIDSKYYPSFVSLDLPALVREAGITVVGERHAFFGTVTIVSGTI